MKVDKCPFCEGVLQNGEAHYLHGDLDLGMFDAKICQKCGEVFFSERATQLIENKAKELGIWGIGKETSISYSGNSIIVRIPKRVAEFMELKPGTKAFVHPEGKKKIGVEIFE